MYLNLEGGAVCVNGDTTTGIVYGGDTGYLELSDTDLENSFIIYSTAQRPRLRKVGKMVHFYGAMSPAVGAVINSASNLSFYTLPSEYRPMSGYVTIRCQGSGINTWLLQITSAGVCSCSRYGTNAYAASIAGTEWLIFNATWFVA
jgi:hypothetical protein